MRVLSKALLFIFSASLPVACLTAQAIRLQQSHADGIYQSGERVQLKVFLPKNYTDSVWVRVRKNYSKHTGRKAFWYSGDSLIVFDESLTGPASVIFDVTTKTDTASLGLITDPQKFIPGTERPADMDAFWKKEKQLLRKLPMEIKAVPVTKNIPDGFSCVDMEINCTGPKPARGYYVKPTGAQPRSLPIVLYVHAAGVSGNWCRSETGNALRYAGMEKGAICFDLNAHGMLNGQPDEYYKDLEKGELNNYSQTGLEDRSTVYFRGMYLRLLRTLDFLTAQPEWDGKRILVIGESQGGGQALAAAGLDPRVTAVVATVPAMCDWGKSLQDSKGGWPNPLDTKNDLNKMMAAVPYYDAAHLLKGSKATIVTEIGLIDFTCSSESVYSAVNQSSGKKIIYTAPYRPHQIAQVSAVNRDLWEKNVAKPKEDFIRDFLK